jgi:hypothetical protein
MEFQFHILSEEELQKVAADTMVGGATLTGLLEHRFGS